MNTIQNPHTNLIAACERLLQWVDCGCDPSKFSWDSLRAEVSEAKERNVMEPDLLADLEACVALLQEPSEARPGARQAVITKSLANIARAKGEA